jgi:hypothetical protein
MEKLRKKFNNIKMNQFVQSNNNKKKSQKSSPAFNLQASYFSITTREKELV